MEKLHLEVVTPARTVVNEDVESVVAPGSLGEFGVLPGHIPFLSGIVPGELRYTVDDKKAHLAVSGGFCEVSGGRIAVLVDAAEVAHEIDLERARKAMERAEERLAQQRGSEDVDFVRAEAALKRAMIRIKIVERVA